MADQNKQEDWMQKKWRPAMGWLYMIVCFCDMIIFPVAWSILQATLHEPITQWNPLTLQGAGLFHLAMGAVLGIAAWGRTQEKLGDKAGFGTATSQMQSPMNMQQPMSYDSPMPAARRTVSTSTTVDYAQPVVGYGGKLAPPPAYQPEL